MLNCIRLLINFFIALTFFAEFVFARSTDAATATNIKNGNAASTNTSTSTGSADGCSSTLVQLLNADFDNKDALLGLVSVSSQAPQCQQKLDEALRPIKSLNLNSIEQKQNASRYLLSRFPKLGSAAGHALDKCNTFNSTDNLLIKSRYVHSISKIENMSSGLVDEVAYIDSLLPTNDGLSKINESCKSSQLFPELSKKCIDYSNKLKTKTCNKTPDEKLDELTNTTLDKLSDYGDLTELLNRCEHNVKSKKENQKSSDCFIIRRQIEMLLVKFPWISSPDFNALKENIKNRNNYGEASDKSKRNRNSWSKESQDKMFAYTKERTKQYLNKMRDSMVDQMNKNFSYSKCLTTNVDIKKSDCNIEKIGQLLDQIPDANISLETNLKKLESQDSLSYSKLLDTEKCLSDKHLERLKKVELINTTAEVGFTAAATLMTSGAYLITSSGLKIVQGISKVNQLKNLAQLNAAINAGSTLYSGAQTFLKCANKESVTQLVNKNNDEVIKNNICPDAHFTKIQEDQDNCLLEELMTIANIGSISVGIGIVSKVAAAAHVAKRKQDLKNFIELSKKRGKTNRDLNFASSMTMDERIEAAEGILGKKLTSNQIEALKKAHGKGGYDFDPDSKITREKDEILQTAFTKKESAILRGNGIAGSFGSDADDVAYIGKTVRIPRSDGTYSVGYVTDVIKDDSGKVVSLRTQWKESNGDIGIKTVSSDKLQFKYDVGDKVYFKRSPDKKTGQRKTSEGIVDGIDSEFNPATGGNRKYYNVKFTEDGVTKYRKTYLDEFDDISHLDPAARINAQAAREAETAATKAAQEKAAREAEAAAARAAQEKAAREAEAAVARAAQEKAAREATAVAKAKEVIKDFDLNQLRSYSRLNFHTFEKPKTIDDVRDALGLHNAKKEELVARIQRELRKYHPDKLEFDKKLQEEATTATNQLNLMRSVLKRD